MRTIRDFHHYRSDEVPDSDRVSRLELRVINLLLSSRLAEKERDSSVAFELKHSSAVTQFARLLAHKRGLSQELCSAGAVLHDVYVIVEGKYKDHARLAEPIARELLADTGFRDAEENEAIIRLIVNHSDKHLYSDDPYIEFGKDADVLDCFLYPGAVEFYLKHKPVAHMFHYLSRAKSIWRDLGISALPNYLTFLDGYHPEWLSETIECSPSHLVAVLTSREAKTRVPSFLLRVENGVARISFSAARAAGNAGATPFAERSNVFRKLGPRQESLEILYDYFKSRQISLADCCGIMFWPPVGLIEPIPNTQVGLNRLQELTGS